MGSPLNIVVIGASNSILGNTGYIRVLRAQHQVTNLSGGDVPIYFMLTQVLENADLIRKADIVILDHTISDRAYYHHTLKDSYLSGLTEFYRLLMTLNPNVVCLIFPSRLERAGNDAYLSALTEICTDLGATMLNLQPELTDPRFFEDELHIHIEISMLLGLFLTQLFSKCSAPLPRPKDLRHPFTVVPAHALPQAPGDIGQFTTSLAQVAYLPLTKPVEITLETLQTLLFVQYVVPPGQDKFTACAINGQAHFFGGLYVTGEVVLAEPSKTFHFAPVEGVHALSLPHLRWQVRDTFHPMNFVKATFRQTDAPLVCAPPPARATPSRDFSPLHRNLERLLQSDWFDAVQPLSDQATQVVDRFTSKPLEERPRFFAETYEEGKRLRRERSALFQRYFESYFA